MIQELDHDSVSLHMRADPDTIYALVADVTRTPEFSPEIVECKWLDATRWRPRAGLRSPTSRW
jgi:ribosome-associated toxin RatA of RatAB toxin-antitoxin module